MRLFCLLLLPCCLQAADITLKLDSQPEGKDKKEPDYGVQLRDKFQKLLKTDRKLAALFVAYENKLESGRCHVAQEVQIIHLASSHHVDFRMDSGTTETSEQIALYFSFSQGEHRGISTQSGFLPTSS